EEVFKDRRFGIRILRKSPGFTIVAILTLAIGIGGTTAVFSVVNSVLLKPLPLKEPDRIVALWSVWKDIKGNVSAGNFVDWQEQSRSMERMAAVQFTNFT